MTNANIITLAMLNAKLDPMTVVVDTYAGWKRKGYAVRRGEKAVFQTKIWKPIKQLSKQEQAEMEKADESTRKQYRKLWLVNAAFFTAEQVEKKEVQDAV